MSDNGTETERALLSNGSDLQGDILVKGQHYSGNSGSSPFLYAVRRRLIIATAREFPEHERISEQWAEGLRDRDIKLFWQDETGAVESKFSGDDWSARAYLTGEVFVASADKSERPVREIFFRTSSPEKASRLATAEQLEIAGEPDLTVRFDENNRVISRDAQDTALFQRNRDSIQKSA